MKRVYFDYSSISKHSHWNQEGAYSLDKIVDQREYKRRSLVVKTKKLEEPKIRKLFQLCFLFSWFDICMIHNPIIILVVKIWFSYKNFKSQLCCAYFVYVFSQYYVLNRWIVHNEKVGHYCWYPQVFSYSNCKLNCAFRGSHDPQ